MTDTSAPRYTVHAIADEDCRSLADDVLHETDDATEAKQLAELESGGYPYGAGIRDHETGEIDVGFGFGVPCPDFA